MYVRDVMWSFFIAVIFDCKSLHVLKSYFPFIISVEDALITGNVCSCRVKLFVHGSVEIHQHFSSSNCFQGSILVVIVHIEQLPTCCNSYWVSCLHLSRLKRPPFSIFATGSWYCLESPSLELYIQIIFIEPSNNYALIIKYWDEPIKRKGFWKQLSSFWKKTAIQVQYFHLLWSFLHHLLQNSSNGSVEPQKKYL